MLSAKHQQPGWLQACITAFRAALDLGVRHLETDVHATLDGQLVAFHDSVLDRVTDATGVVADLPLKTVRRALIGGLSPATVYWYRFTDDSGAGSRVGRTITAPRHVVREPITGFVLDQLQQQA